MNNEFPDAGTEEAEVEIFKRQKIFASIMSKEQCFPEMKWKSEKSVQ